MGPRAWWLVGMPRRKRERGKRIQYPISYAGTTLRPSRTYDREKKRERETKGGRMDGAEGKSKTGRELQRYTTQLVSSVFPSFGSQYSNSHLSPPPLPPPSPNLPNESALRPTSSSSILPAARYRLPNNLTDCSAHRLPARYPCPGFLPKCLRISCDPSFGRKKRGKEGMRFVENARV